MKHKFCKIFISAVTMIALFLFVFVSPVYAKNEAPQYWKKCVVNYDDALSSVDGTITNVEEGSLDEGFEFNISDMNYSGYGATSVGGVSNGYYMQWQLPWELNGLTDAVDVEFTIQYNDFAEYLLGGYTQLRRIEFALKSFFISGGYAQPCQNFEIWFVNGNNNILLSKRTAVDNPTTEFNVDFYCDTVIDPNAHFKIKFKSIVPYSLGQASYFRINIMYAGNALWLENLNITDDVVADEAESERYELDSDISDADSNADSVLDELGKNTAPDIGDITLAPEIITDLEDVGAFYDKKSTFYTTLIMLAVSSLGIALVGYVLHGKR